MLKLITPTRLLFILAIFLLADCVEAQKIEQKPNFSKCADYKFEKDRSDCMTKTLKRIMIRSRIGVFDHEIVRVEANVDVNGHVQSAKAIDGTTMDIRSEAVRTVLAINGHTDKFLPALSDGLAVACLDTFSIEFGLASETDDIFKIVESMPRFPGCEDMDGSNKEKEACATKLMLQYVYRNQRYPQEAKEKGIQGQVVISFIVEKDGSIAEVKVLRDKGAGLGEEAKRIVESFNDMDQKWTPGKQRGTPVRVQYNLPVKFSLP